MSRVRVVLAGAGAAALLGAGVVAMVSHSSASAPRSPARDLALATTLRGEDVAVSAIERGLPVQAASATRTSRSGGATPRPAAEPEAAALDVPAPTPLEVVPVEMAAPVAAPVVVEAMAAPSGSSNVMSLAPGQSVGVTTSSAAGTDAGVGAAGGRWADFRGEGPSVRLGGGHGGGHCRGRGAGGGTLVLR